MVSRNRLIKSSRWVVRTAFLANRLLLLGILILFLLSWIFSAQFAALLLQSDPRGNMRSAMTGFRLEMLIGIVLGMAADRLLVALAQIIASVSAGDPFILANAHRLKIIGWSLFALQLIDIPLSLLGRFFPAMGSAAPSDTFSAGGWISVLMVFVLSRVFAAGSAMRNELEGTV